MRFILKIACTFSIYLILITLVACKKGSDSQGQDLVEVTYEIQTTVSGFSQLHYLQNKPGESSSETIDWTITSPGTYTKKVKVIKDQLAEISCIHPSSNAWKLIIKSSTGSILKETTAISFFSGPPSYYYAIIGAAAQ